MKYNFEIPNKNTLLKQKCIRHISIKTPIDEFSLNEGDFHLNNLQIFQMCRRLQNKADNHVLLCGMSCYFDVIMIDNYIEKLKELNIILCSSSRIVNNSAYLIPLISYNPFKLHEDFVRFTK